MLTEFLSSLQHSLLSGYMNVFEARFLVEFASYLITKGYKREEITILTPYTLQARLIRKVSTFEITSRVTYDVPSVNKVLRAPIFLHLRNFETERYTQEKHQIKSFDLKEIYEFDFSFFAVSRFVPKLRKFKKIGARNT